MENNPEKSGNNRNPEGNPNRNPDGTFKPGVSGNPNGKPPGTLSITALIKAELEKKNKENDKTYATELIEKILDKALKEGDNKMIERIWAYIDGMPKESKDVSIFTPKPLMDLTNGICNNDSNKEDSETNKED